MSPDNQMAPALLEQPGARPTPPGGIDMNTVGATITCRDCKRTATEGDPARQWWEPIGEGAMLCEDCYYRAVDAAEATGPAATVGGRYDALIALLRDQLTPAQFGLVIELDRVVGERLTEAGGRHNGDDLEARVERIEEIIAQLGDVAAGITRHTPA